MQNLKNTNKHKVRVHTLLMFLLSLLVTCGGWLFTKQILKYKETLLLSKSGELLVSDSVHSLLKADDQNLDTNTDKDSETAESDIFHGKTMSEDQTAQILSCWESSTRLISQDPQKGQMTMEQAIHAGIDWITNMSENNALSSNIISSDLSQDNFENIHAILYTSEENQMISDDLLSRWVVSYTLKDVCIRLTIHAASGQIWQADISAPIDAMPISDHMNEEHMLKTAFPFFTDGGTEISQNIDNGDYQIRIESAKRKLYAKVSLSMISENAKKTLTVISLSLNRTP